MHQILDWAIHNTSLNLVHWFKVWLEKVSLGGSLVIVLVVRGAGGL